MKYIPFLFLYCLFSTMCSAQIIRDNDAPAILFDISYGIQSPAGDLVDRFGMNFNLGLGLTYQSQKSNILIGLDGDFLFGNQVKENTILPLLTPQGFIIGNDRAFADINLRQRGFYVGVFVGKVFELSSNVKKSGIRATFGVGLLEHRIRIQDDPSREVPQLLGDYKKGYDRLTNGLALNQFIGYHLLSANRRINFYAGIDLTQAFTQSRRNFDFDTQQQNTTQRLDLLFGLRFGWILPFYLGDSDEIYY